MTYKDKYDYLIKQIEDKVVPSLLFYAKELGKDILLIHGERQFIFGNHEGGVIPSGKTIIVGRLFDKRHLSWVHGDNIDTIEFLIKEANKYAKIDQLIIECKKLVDIDTATREILFEKTNI